MFGAADLKPGNLLGVAQPPLIREPNDVFQRKKGAPAFSPVHGRT